MARKPANSPSTFTWKSILRWPAFLLANAAIFLLVGVSTLRETYNGWTVERQIGALQEQAQSLEGRKMKLVQLTQSLASPEHVELEARERLGLKKDGERVFVLDGSQPTVASSSSQDPDVYLPTTEVFPSNPQLWWNYLFKQPS
jgi:cell division protein FtsB